MLLTNNKLPMKKTVLITGAANGFGYEFAKLFAVKNYKLILVDINEEKMVCVAKELESKHNIKVYCINCDLALTDSAIIIYNYVKELELKVNILINNAGFGDFGFFYKTDWEKENRMLQLNIITLTHLTKLFIKEMIDAGEGKVLNVSSIAAFQPSPLMSLYFASKSFVLFFSEAIANELKGTGVTVTALCPGKSNTGFAKAVGHDKSKFEDNKIILTAPGYVAKFGYLAMMKGKSVAIPGKLNFILANAPRFFTRKFVINFNRRLFNRYINV